MATHSSILAWRIPWTEELGGLQSTGRKESDTTSLSLSLILYSDLPCVTHKDFFFFLTRWGEDIELSQLTSLKMINILSHF